MHDRLDRDLLVRAYRFSEEAHRGQMRNSGEPYVTHCVEVAKILADLQLDTIDRRQRADSRRRRGHAVTVADVEREFGKEIAAIVDGLTKIANLPSGAARQRGPPGRELSQAAALDREGRARHHRQARRPAAQHAHAGVAPAGEATAHRPGDARSVRAARPSLRHGEAPVGARGSRVQASRAGRLQVAREAGRAEARRARGADRADARAARAALARAAGIKQRRGHRPARSISGRSTRR